MAINTEFVRLTIKEGAKDRFLTCLALDPPTDKKDRGQLFVLVEITRRWFPSTQIGQSLIGVLSRSYYRADSTSELANFEQSVAQVNRHLANLFNQGETDWVDHLHSSLILINQATIHLATTGELPVWLWHNRHFTMISEPVDLGSILPSKIFGSITSGTLAAGDRLFIGSTLVSETIPQATVRQWLEHLPDDQVGRELARMLKKHRISQAAGLIISTTDQPPHPPLVIYLDQPLEPLSAKFGQLVKPVTQLARRLPLLLGDQSVRLAEVVKRGWSIVKPKLNRLQKLTSRPKPAPSSHPDRQASLIGRTIFTIHEYRTGRRLRLNQSKQLLTDLLHWFRRSKKIRTNWPLAGAVILSLFLISSIAWQKNQTARRQSARQQEQLLEEASRSFQAGKTALVFNNRHQAQLAFSQTIELANQLIDADRYQARAKDLIAQTELELDTLIGATRLKSLKPITTAETIRSVLVYEGRLLTIKDNDPTVYQQNPVDPTPVPYLTLTNPPRLIRPLLTDQFLYLVTEKTIEQINLLNQQITIFTPPPPTQLTDIIDLKQFGSALYALQPSINKIAKLPLHGDSIGDITNYLKRGEVKNGVGLAVDGAVYVLTNQGQVVKFSRGEKQEFALSGLPKPRDKVSQPLQIDTSADTPSILVVDAEPSQPRILEFDKNGQYLHQFILPANLGQLKSVFYQLKGRKAWLVLGDGVYEVNL